MDWAPAWLKTPKLQHLNSRMFWFGDSRVFYNASGWYALAWMHLATNTTVDIPWMWQARKGGYSPEIPSTWQGHPGGNANFVMGDCSVGNQTYQQWLNKPQADKNIFRYGRENE
jgi:prepilin-type processing-associated H-X9-DG protein